MISEEEKCDNTSQQQAESASEGSNATVDEATAAAASAASAAAADGEAAEAAKPAEEPAKPAEPTLEEKLAELQDKYLRTLAEYDNYRKRMAREMQSAREYTKRSTLQDVVGAYDLLQMAVEASASAKDMKAIQDGIKMTFGEFQRTLKQLGVEAVDARGQKFDPALHEAIQSVPSETVPEGVVIQQWKSGFKLDGKLLRAAVVVVSSGPAKPAEPEPPAEDRQAEAAVAQEDSPAAETSPEPAAAGDQDGPATQAPKEE